MAELDSDNVFVGILCGTGRLLDGLQADHLVWMPWRRYAALLGIEGAKPRIYAESESDSCGDVFQAGFQVRDA